MKLKSSRAVARWPLAAKKSLPLSVRITTVVVAAACVSLSWALLARARFSAEIAHLKRDSVQIHGYVDCPKPYAVECCLSLPQLKETTGYRMLSLVETFDFLRKGGSLARLGDGEVLVLNNGTNVFEEQTSQELVTALRFVTKFGGRPQDFPYICLGTYPFLDGNFSRFRSGNRRTYAEHIFEEYMQTWREHMPKGVYCNSFISRPDGVDPHLFPAIEFYTPSWQSIFKGLKVLLVAGQNKHGAPMTRDGSVFVRHLSTTSQVFRLTSFLNSKNQYQTINEKNMFSEYTSLRNAIMDLVLSNEIDVVILSLGATATIMATELSCRGIRAMDVGQFGGNFTKS